LVLIGLPDSIITFDEGQKALAEIINEQNGGED
jgi:hypothetical protein